jgi:hypothetical protein
MNYIPWRLAKSWRCLACGSCCGRYAVNLTWEEYRRIGKFWPDRVRIKNRKPYLGRRIDGRCEFLSRKLCHLQVLNMKPSVCKIWPFKVLLKPARMDKNFDGLYQTGTKEYFVYLNPKCSGISRGNSIHFNSTIEEIINLWSGLKKEQYYSTNRAYLGQVLSLEKEGKVNMSRNLSPSVQRVQNGLKTLGLPYQVVELAHSTGSVREAAEAVGCRGGQIARFLVFKGKRNSKPVLVIASGSNRLNEEKNMFWKPTGAIMKFLGGVAQEEVEGKPAASFDTQYEGWFAGNGAKRIEKKLRGLGLRIIRPPLIAYVEGRGSTVRLKKGELEKAANFATVFFIGS